MVIKCYQWLLMMMMMDAAGLGSEHFHRKPAGEITAIENQSTTHPSHPSQSGRSLFFSSRNQSPPGMVPRLGGNKPMGFAKEKHIIQRMAIPSH
jgi:hypothetical protein